MKNKTFTLTNFSPNWVKLFIVILVAASTVLWSCDKTDETVKPEALTASKGQTIKSGKEKEDKDDKYKTDKTGQYVNKDVQITGYEDGSQRPTRPKYDEADPSMGLYPLPDDPCDGCGGGGGGTYTPPASTFVSSESLGGYGVYPNQFPENLNNYIQDLKIAKGSSSSIGTDDPGYYKIPVDLNRGAGGKYIYLCFTRDPNRVKGSDSGPSAWVNSTGAGKYVPVKDIVVESETIGDPTRSWPYYDCSPPIELKDALGYHCPDLNDGAGGKYIYAYQVKCSTNKAPIKEVGVIYGASSAIQPPSGWVKIPGDLNEGAGGDYIYFCVKY